MSIDLGRAVGYLDIDASGFHRGFSSAWQDMKVFEDSSATFSDKMVGVGSAMAGIGSSLTKYATVPLVGVGAAAVVVGNKFEAQMSRVQAIAGATGDELGQLTDQALDLGAKTSFSAAEAAEGMENLASAGFSTKEIMKAMPGLLDLAASSGASLADASEIAASAIRGFGLDASSSSHVADIFALAAAKTNAQTEDMGEAMKYVAPVAHAMGISIEETAAAVGIMSDAGVKGSQAGTSLRSAFSRLVKPTETMENKMKELGISFFDSEGKMLSIQGIVEQLKEGTAGLTQEQTNNAIVTLFGQDALSGMLALIQRGPDELGSLTDALENSDGAAKDMADTMLDNTAGSLEQLLGSVETLAIKLQQVLAPTVKNVLDRLTEFVNKLSSLDDSTLQTIVKIAGFVAAIGPVLLVVGKVTSGIGKIIGIVQGAHAAMSAINVALAAAGTSLSAIIWPILAVIAAVVALKLAWDSNFGGIREKTASMFDALKTVFNQIVSLVQWFAELFTELWSSNWMGIQDIFGAIINHFEIIFSTALDVLVNIFQFFANVFTGNWSGAWENIKGIFSSIWEGIQSLLMNFLNILVDTLIRVGVRLLAGAKQAFINIKQGFLEIWENIKGWFSAAVEDPVGILEGIGSKLFEVGKSIFNMMWDGLKSVWEGIVNWVQNAVDWIVSKVQFWKDESAKVNNSDSSGGKNSHASGLDYVPYDGYRATLHEGERVLTRQENRNSVGSSDGDTFIFNSPEPIDEVKAARELKRVKRELAEGI